MCTHKIVFGTFWEYENFEVNALRKLLNCVWFWGGGQKYGQLSEEDKESANANDFAKW